MIPPQPTIQALHAAYRDGATAEAAVEAVYRRIETVADPGIFLSTLPVEDALRHARTLGRFDPAAKPLWGIPFAIKDNIDLEGLPTTAACPAFAYTPKASAPAVARLIAAGAIPIGKTNLDQFATGLVGTRTPYPIPRNALDPELIPGGSSSGSAVAVAQGIVAFALGTDTAGSGRVPAALNGIVGLKPSLGAVSTRGVVPACRTLDCVSVFARTAADAWSVFTTMAAPDPHDPFARTRPVAAMAGLPPVLRIGVPRDDRREFFGDAAAASAFDAHLGKLPPGTDVVPVDMAPFFDVAKLLYDGPWVAERHAAIRDFMDRNGAQMHPVTRSIIDSARRYSATDAFAGQYRLAELRRLCAAVWSEVDALCLPSVPTLYTVAEALADPFGPNARLGTYTNFANLLDLCALAVPGPARTDGRPAGVTFVAPAGQDGFLASLGQAFAAGRPDGVAVPPRLVPLAVAGAHMSGMPLNLDLTALGACFLAEMRTAPHFRLYALPGGYPPRPGLVRTDRGGAAIAVELWAIPPEGLGRLMAALPPPLGIGTVPLEDGRIARGFLAEACATAEARDITDFGGWRSYLRTCPDDAA